MDLWCIVLRVDQVQNESEPNEACERLVWRFFTCTLEGAKHLK